MSVVIGIALTTGFLGLLLLAGLCGAAYFRYKCLLDYHHGLGGVSSPKECRHCQEFFNLAALRRKR